MLSLGKPVKVQWKKNQICEIWGPCSGVQQNWTNGRNFISNTWIYTCTHSRFKPLDDVQIGSM